MDVAWLFDEREWEAKVEALVQRTVRHLLPVVRSKSDDIRARRHVIEERAPDHLLTFSTGHLLFGSVVENDVGVLVEQHHSHRQRVEDAAQKILIFHTNTPPKAAFGVNYEFV